MRKKLWFLVLSALLLTLAGCAVFGEQEDGGYKLFCVSAEGTSLEEQSYTPKAAGGKTLVKEMLNAMAGQITRSGCRSVFPEGLSVKVSTLKDGRLTIDFNDIYKSMDHIHEVLFRAAVVQTMTQIADVQEIVFTIEGEALLNSANEAVGPMQASSFLNSEGESINAYQYQALSLYFAVSGGECLAKQMRNVHYAPETSLERMVVEQLIKGPSGRGLLSVLPADTEILDVTLDGELCIVNLNAACNRKPEEITVGAEISVYAIVNSICDSSEDIRKVQLQIEGSSDVQLWNEVDLSKPFERRDDLIREQDGGSAKEGNHAAGIGVEPGLTSEEQEESKM